MGSNSNLVYVCIQMYFVHLCVCVHLCVHMCIFLFSFLFSSFLTSEPTAQHTNKARVKVNIPF